MGQETIVTQKTSTRQVVALITGMIGAFALGMGILVSLEVPDLTEPLPSPLKPRFVQMQGWPQTTPSYGTSIPGTVNLDGDDDLEIVRGTRHTIYAYNPDGTHVAGWPYQLSVMPEDQDSFVGSPTFSTNLDADADAEVIFSTFRWYGTGTSKVYALNHDGTLVPGFPISLPADAKETPVVGDITGDGRDDIVVSVPAANKLFAFNGAGQSVSGWPKSVTGGWAHPVLADMNVKSPGLEVIYGGSSRIYVFTGEQRPPLLPECWPYAVQPAVSEIGQVVTADLNQSGDTEIIFAAKVQETSEVKLFAMDNRCQVLSGWPVKMRHSYTLQNYVPVVGDVNGDFSPEVVYPDGTWDTTIAGPSLLHVLKSNGTELPNWPVETFSGLQKPALMDLNGDKKLDVVYQDGQFVYARNYRSNVLPTFPIAENGGGVMQFVATDIDGNSTPELIIADYGFRMNVLTLEGVTQVKGYDWPKYQQNVAATGSVKPKITPTCQDTDPANDPYIKGETTGVDSYGKTYTSPDTCYGVNAQGIGTQVGQFYCQSASPEGSVSAQQVTDCPKGCLASAGACI